MVPKSQIAYVDETGIDTYLHREYCWLRRGQKLIGYVSGKRYRRVGVIAAQMDKDIIAPLQYDGTMNSELFELWFETTLLSHLPIIPNGSCSAHEVDNGICVESILHTLTPHQN